MKMNGNVILKYLIAVCLVTTSFSTRAMDMGASVSIGATGPVFLALLDLDRHLGARLGYNSLTVGQPISGNGVRDNTNVDHETGEFVFDRYRGLGAFSAGELDSSKNSRENNVPESFGGLASSAHAALAESNYRYSNYDAYAGAVAVEDPGFNFIADVGVLFLNRPDLTLVAVDTSAPIMQAQIDQEENIALLDEIEDVHLWLGFVYSF